MAAEAPNCYGRGRFLQISQAHLTRESWGLGVSVQPLTTDQTKTGGVAGSRGLSNFSFTAGGSTYAVSAGKDGAMVGTKDGKAWKTWQITPNLNLHATSSAESVLSTMKTLADKLRSATGDQDGTPPVLGMTV